MLHPQDNRYRCAINLSGLWRFALDPDDRGESAGWPEGLLPEARWIAVPGSWNEQFQDTRDFLGPAWYETSFVLPQSWGWAPDDWPIFLRFGSAQYRARVWLNGTFLGEHEGGHLPFDLDCRQTARPEEANRLVVRVDGRLGPNTVPPGALGATPGITFGQEVYPDVNFDFYPYAGLHRPVWVYTRCRYGMADLWVTTELAGDAGRVLVRIAVPQGEGAVAIGRLLGQGHARQSEATVSGGEARFEIALPRVRPWSPADPYLYDLDLEIQVRNKCIDRYLLPVGVRTIQVEGDRLLLNGQPLFLRGCARHEDFPVSGRGLFLPLVVKDYDLLRWLGANSFRTSHYPYADELMDLADRLGFLVVDETPAVGLYFGDKGEGARLQLCRQQLGELIARDKNHPSVIMWSVANEPHTTYPEAGPFLSALYEEARRLDPTRPVTFASSGPPSGLEEAFRQAFDVVCINRYYGWYTLPGRLDAACRALAEELDRVHAAFGKPVILSEFGADSVAGLHADPPEMFSEEYQAALIEGYLGVCAERPWVVGAHVWNFADFKTAQAVHRVVLNRKGVFTRERQPKMAAHVLRHLWNGNRTSMRKT